MAANTIAMYFKVDPACLKSAEFWKQLEKVGMISLGEMAGEPVTIDMNSSTDRLLVFQGSDKSHATVRVYSDGLITVDIQHFVEDGGKADYTLADLQVKSILAMGGLKSQLSEEYIRALEDRLKALFGENCYEANSLYTPIRRGMTVWPYMVTADERLQELDYDKLVYEKDSKWQNIRIYHSIEHGNILFLDGDIMLGESDLIYTQTLCCIGKENYKGKTVLILGGGDGGILHELLKEGPDLVVMAEIDEEVIKACQTHMRSVCGSSMDNYEGPHHQIRIEDCIKVLHEYISSGRKFDFVINDLTEFPVDKALKGYSYDFETTSLITELSLKALKPDGKLLARGNCLSAFEYRDSFEKDIKTVGCEFKRKDVYVPSFHETYCLYEIWHSC